MEYYKRRITGGSPGRRIRRGALVLSTCAGLAFGAGTPALAASNTAAQTASASAAAQVATPLASPSGQTVTLPTGDRVTITTVGGHTSYSVTGPAGGRTQYVSYQDASGDRYVIPDEARPYLGRQLDKSLFDVSALLRAGAATGTRIPVNVSFPLGTTPAAPPGVTMTSASTGYLTATSGVALAAGLRAAIGADVAAGRHAGSGPLFGGLTSMSLAVPGVGVSTGGVSPRFPLHILQIDATDLTGAPADNAVAFVVNTDSVSRENGFVPVVGGLARVAVPAGNYSANLQFAEFDSSGFVTAIRTVVIDDFSVAAAGTTTVSADERTSTVPFTVTTPRPATSDGLLVNWFRQDTAGKTQAFINIVFGGGVVIYTNAQPVPTVGKQHYVVQWGAAGPSTGDQYRYDLAYGSDDIPANQTYTVQPDNVATVHHTFSSDPASPGGGSFLSGGYDSFAGGSFELSGGELYSGPLTEYLGAGDGGQWAQSFFTPTGFQYGADVHTFQSGREYEIDWAHGPLAPNVGRHTGPQLFYPCLACASGGSLIAAINLDGDSEPDHGGIPFAGGWTSHYSLYQNGTLIKDLGSGFIGAEVTGVPVAPTTYRVVYDTDDTAIPKLSQSLTTHTDVTFQYVPSSDPHTTLPSTDICDFTGAMPRPCQVLPVLNLDYHLFTDDTNTARTAFQGMELNIGHLTYDGFGSHAPITSASVSVSFDGGKTWQQARAVKIGDFGSYDAFWRNPASAAGTSPELRVTATDSLGGSISQTVTAAYTISASVH